MDMILVSYKESRQHYSYRDNGYDVVEKSDFRISHFDKEEHIIDHLYNKLIHNEDSEFSNLIFLNWHNLLEQSQTYLRDTVKGVDSIWVAGEFDQYYDNEEWHTDDYVDNSKERTELQTRIRNAVQEKIDIEHKRVQKILDERKEKDDKERSEREMRLKIAQYEKLKREFEELGQKLEEENK